MRYVFGFGFALALGFALMSGCSDENGEGGNGGTGAVGGGGSGGTGAVGGGGTGGMAGEGGCETVELAFEGHVATMSGAPLGLGPAWDEPVSGKLGYSLCVEDSYVSDPLRGAYDHDSGGIFEFEVLSKTVLGSGKPRVLVENLAQADMFHFEDGKYPIDQKDRTMYVNSQPDPSLGASFHITDPDATAFASDELPAIFPITGAGGSHISFWLQDSNGTLVMEVTSLSQL